MAWNPLITGDIAVGKPVTRSMLTKIKDCLDFLNGTIGTLATAGVVNGSFEIDSDADGVPDSWTKNLYPGGSGAIDTTVAVHGAAAYKFVHPGGASNGGGYLRSDYVQCTPHVPGLLHLVHWATNAAMKNQVRIQWYTGAKVFISETIVYTSTLNPTAATLIVCGYTPPSTARYMCIDLVGGYTDTNQAGTAYFDAVFIEPFQRFSNTLLNPFTFTEVTGVIDDTSFINVGSPVTIKTRTAGVPIIISIPNLEFKDSNATAVVARVHCTAAGTSSNSMTWTATTSYVETSTVFTIAIPAAYNSGTVALQMQACHQDSGYSSSQFYVRKSANNGSLVIDNTGITL